MPSLGAEELAIADRGEQARAAARVTRRDVRQHRRPGRGAVGESGQAPVGWSDTLLAITPQLQRDREPIDLRLQFRQALFEPGSFLEHRVGES